MAIYRGVLPSDGFTVVPNAWVRDRRLSYKAKGILVYIASHSAGYALTQEQIAAEAADGKDAVRAGLAELEAVGYLTRTRRRDPETGRLSGTDYYLGDPPAGLPTVGKPDSGPDLAEQDVSAGGDQGGFSNVGESAPKKNISKKTKGEDQLSLVPPLDLFAEFWEAYPKKADKQVAKATWQKRVVQAKVDQAMVVAAAKAHRDDPNREDQFTKNPQRWLNAGSWENGPLPGPKGPRQPAFQRPMIVNGNGPSQEWYG